MRELYSPFVRTNEKIIEMDVRSAELTKYAANMMLAARISLANEIANLCAKVGAKYDHVRRGIGTDSRIGEKFLFAGIGYGGSCFPKDIRALKKTGEEFGLDMALIKAIDIVNENQKTALLKYILHHYQNNVSGKRFGFWGLSFKPNTDDIRESPPLVIIQSLLSNGASIIAYDPQATENAKKLFGSKITFSDNKYDATSKVDGLIIATQWDEFYNPDFLEIKKRMKNPVIFDGRNIYDSEKLKKLGFIYYSIGNN
jgi:UDPglucose 6-dehydrogenase